MAVWSCRRGGAFEPHEKEINAEIEFAFQEGYLAVLLEISEGDLPSEYSLRDSLGFNGDCPPEVYSPERPIEVVMRERSQELRYIV